MVLRNRESEEFREQSSGNIRTIRPWQHCLPTRTPPIMVWFWKSDMLLVLDAAVLQEMLPLLLGVLLLLGESEGYSIAVSKR
jgi:hypothetical protein